MADHPLKPATDHRLGRPLPPQLANQTQAHLLAIFHHFTSQQYEVLATVSSGCPSPKGRFLRVTHPSATQSLWKPQRASYDLHVLSIPPAFILSQDQTLREHKVFYYVTYITILSFIKDVKPTCLFLIEKKTQ